MDALTGPNRKSAPIKSQFVQFNESLTHCAFFQYQIYIVFHARENSLQRIPRSAESTSAYVFICPRHCNCVSCLLVNIATLPHNTIHHKRVFFVLVCWCLLLLCPLIRPLRRKNLDAGKHTFVHTYGNEWGGDDDDDDDADAVPSIVVSLLYSYLYAQLMESPQCLRFGSCDTYCMLNSPQNKFHDQTDRNWAHRPTVEGRGISTDLYVISRQAKWELSIRLRPPNNV